ncbi:hypothetical protein FN846DRAFT_127007 [Sphaerosporella brunnea]|uniref:Uncharacterized protein n=1 Tax=Sphaerosporella brunnea TaxID=1250544 RepID=A0A5J5ERU3_9PEZI|nr:hypothetical protein FN846DRAFT_127007 [Sphaerosporella brunnea]
MAPTTFFSSSQHSKDTSPSVGAPSSSSPPSFTQSSSSPETASQSAVFLSAEAHHTTTTTPTMTTTSARCNIPSCPCLKGIFKLPLGSATFSSATLFCARSGCNHTLADHDDSTNEASSNNKQPATDEGNIFVSKKKFKYYPQLSVFRFT